MAGSQNRGTGGTSSGTPVGSAVTPAETARDPEAAKSPEGVPGTGAAETSSNAEPEVAKPVAPSAAAPDAAETDAAETDAAETEEAETEEAQTGTVQTGAAVGKDPAQGSDTAPEAGSGADASAATAALAESGATATAAATATATTTVPDDGGTDVHRPKKAMLAAAALAGSVLLAVPLLLAVQEPDKDDAGAADLAAGTTLQGDGPQDGAGAGGVYAAQSPSPTPSPTPSAKPSAKDDAPIVRGQAPAAASPKPSAAPKPSRTPKATAAPKKAPPSHPGISRVLLKNLKTQMCADVPGYGKGAPDGAVNQFHCAGGNGDNQVWTLDMRYADTSPEGGDLYQIRNVKDGLCMDLPGYGPAGVGTDVSEFPCNGTTGDNQLWWLDARPGGTYWIRSFSSDGLCLDVSNKDGGGPDARLTIFPCNDADDHRWSFLG